MRAKSHKQQSGYEISVGGLTGLGWTSYLIEAEVEIGRTVLLTHHHILDRMNAIHDYLNKKKYSTLTGQSWMMEFEGRELDG